MTTQDTRQVNHDAKGIKIAAAIAAGPRWAIAGMAADGAAFRWSGQQWYEVASGLFSLGFAVVEIIAANYMMQAWHKAQAIGYTNRARNLRRLWVATLIVLTASLVPPMYANVTKQSVADFHPLVVIAWLCCIAASTFLVIGGVGYADEATSQPSAQPAASPLAGAGIANRDENSPATGSESCEDAIQSRQNATSSDLGTKSDTDTIPAETHLEPAFLRDLPTLTFDSYQLTGDKSRDVVELVKLAPNATNAQVARRVGCSAELVRQVRASLGNGHAKESASV